MGCLQRQLQLQGCEHACVELSCCERTMWCVSNWCNTGLAAFCSCPPSCSAPVMAGQLDKEASAWRPMQHLKRKEGQCWSGAGRLHAMAHLGQGNKHTCPEDVSYRLHNISGMIQNQ